MTRCLIMIDHLFTYNKTVQRLYLHTLDWKRAGETRFRKMRADSGVKTVRRNGLNFIRMEIKKDRWLGDQG